MSSYSSNTYVRRDRHKSRNDPGFWTVRLPRYGVRPSVNTIHTFEDPYDSQTVYSSDVYEADVRIGYEYDVAPGRSNGSVAGGYSRSHRNNDRRPTKIHRFYEKARDQTPPSWFLPNCSRELAEMVLQSGRDFGNTLMRESRSHMHSGSYSISKAVWNQRTGTCTFEHYEVQQVAGGYKVNVENEHEPMRYLTQVMEYFIKTTGGSSMPMSTNDLRQLGVERQADYDRVLRPQQGEAWVWPPPDYDEAEPPRQWPVEPEPPRAHTVTPRTSEKRVGFSASTVSVPSNRQRSQASLSDIADRTIAADQLQQFDRIIDQYDQRTPPSTKNNSPASSVSNAGTTPKKQTPASSIPAPPPPPPPPLPSTIPTTNSHTAAAPVNVTNSVPVAPPPPPPAPPTAHVMSPQHSHVKEGNGPTSPPPSSMSSRPQSMGNPPASPSANSNRFLRKTSQGEPVSSRPVSAVSTGSSNNSSSGSAGSNGSWQNPKRLSQPGTNITGSPSKLPTWSNSSPKPCVTSPTGSQSIYDDTVSKTPDDHPGVDDKTPGGVHDLKSKFEKKLSVGSIVTGSVEKRPGVKRVTIQEHADTPARESPAGRLNQNRRQSEPAVLSTARAQSDVADGARKLEGLTLEFKNKLEEVFGGTTTSASGPLSPATGRPRLVQHENEYEELPDGHIVPDEVTYVNDAFNKQ